MKKINYPLFNAELTRTKLDNGMVVNLLPRHMFHKTYAILTVDYGSVDDTFQDENGKIRKVPAGIAHFLEHKMFEKKDHDAFDLFSRYGADANAFTSYTRTSYLFSTTRHLRECMNVLLNFVQDPYFSQKSVDKEKGIIAEEIKMYDDDPYWCLYQVTMGNLYPKSQLSLDIAGSTESIQQIKPEDLYLCYNNFYSSANMNLFVTGNFDAEQMLMTIKENQDYKQVNNAPVPGRIFEPTRYPVIKSAEDKMNVSEPKVMIGIRGDKPLPQSREGLKRRIAINLLLELLLSETSDNFQQLYDSGLIDDSFDYEIQIERGFYFLLISGNTKDPEKFVSEIKKILLQAQDQVINQKNELELATRELLGRTIKSLNSLEAIANRYEGKLFDNATIFDIPDLLKDIKIEDLIIAARELINFDNATVTQILPEEGEEQE